jgi:hypothetical protein
LFAKGQGLRVAKPAPRPLAIPVPRHASFKSKKMIYLSDRHSRFLSRRAVSGFYRSDKSFFLPERENLFFTVKKAEEKILDTSRERERES